MLRGETEPSSWNWNLFVQYDTFSAVFVLILNHLNRGEMFFKAAATDYFKPNLSYLSVSRCVFPPSQFKPTQDNEAEK